MARTLRNSVIEWIGDIPEEWETLKGKNILEIMKRPYQAGDGVVTCFRDGQVTLRSNRREEGFTFSDKEIGYQGIKCGDLVIHGMDGFAGAIGISDSEGKGSPILNVCNAKVNAHLKFIMYYLRMLSLQNVFVALATGIRERSCDLRWNKIAELLFPLPSFSEQQAIADYLDRKFEIIDRTIEKQKSVVDKLKLYKQSVITEAVTKGLNPIAKMKTSGIEWIGDIPEGWEVRKLKGIGEAIIGLTYSPTEVSDEGILVLRSSNVQNGKIVVLDDNVYVDKKIQDKLIVKAGDILICSRNGSKALIGKCAYIDEATAGHSFGAFMTVFRSVHNRFLFYVFNSAIFSFHLGTFLTSTINQLTTGNLNSIQIPLPQLPEQQNIADYLDIKCTGIDNVINSKQKLIEKLTDYKKSLIYECVTGKRGVM